MFETSRSRAGRSRFPPPARMWWPASVIVLIGLWKFRRSSSSTSCSFGATSSMMRSIREAWSWTVFGTVTAAKDKRSLSWLSTAVICELQRNSEVALADDVDGPLQVVLAPADHADLVALNRRLHLQLGVLDGLDDRFRFLALDALNDLRSLPDRAERRLLDLSVIEGLERHLPLDEPAFDDVLQAAQLPLVVADQNELVLAQLDLALASLEIEALRQLLLRLLDGVRDLLHVGLRNDVERKLLCHFSLLARPGRPSGPRT